LQVAVQVVVEMMEVQEQVDLAEGVMVVMVQMETMVQLILVAVAVDQVIYLVNHTLDKAEMVVVVSLSYQYLHQVILELQLDHQQFLQKVLTQK
jgi:hypothetical protein